MKKATKYVEKKRGVLQTEPNTRYRKYRESAHMSLVDHPISQPSLDISPTWTPIIAVEVRKLQVRPVWIMLESCFGFCTAQNLSLQCGLIF
jgi:hypothetical protein